MEKENNFKIETQFLPSVFKVVPPSGVPEYVEADEITVDLVKDQIVLEKVEGLKRVGVAVIAFGSNVMKCSPTEYQLHKEELKKKHAIKLAQMVVDATAGILAAFPRVDSSKFAPAGKSGSVRPATVEDVKKASEAILKAANKDTRKKWYKWW